MNRSLLPILIIVLMMHALVIECRAQHEVDYSDEAERVFTAGVDSFAHHQYEEAVALFQNIRRNYARNQRTTAAYVMEGKALFELGRYREAVKLLDEFLQSYPQSLYVADAHFVIGAAYYSQEQYVAAASSFLIVIQRTTDQKLLTRAVDFLQNITDEQIKLDDIRELLRTGKTETIRKLLTLLLAERELDAGLFVDAQQHAREVLGFRENAAIDERARILMARIREGSSVSVGVLLPLMNNDSKQSSIRLAATQMYNGIKLAADEYNASLERGGIGITIDVRDSKRDPAIAQAEVQSWLTDQRFIAIVGPLFSNEVSAIALSANASSIPLVTPTATDNGLAEIGHYIFQANPSYEIRARAMAQYAIKQLGHTRVAVIAPNVQLNKDMADVFVDEATKLGAAIISNRRYIKGATDLRHIFRALRSEAALAIATYDISFTGKLPYAEVMKRLQAAGVKPATVESLMTKNGSVSAEFLFGPTAKTIADSLQIPLNKIVINNDSLHFPVDGIQSLFCPIAETNEIGVITSQLAYFNIRCTVIGTSEWNDLNELDLNKRYAEGVRFLSDRWMGSSNDQELFNAKYANLFGSAPTENALFGYDAMRLIVESVRAGAATRALLTAQLSAINDFPGLHSRISFTNRRINSFLHILEYRHGRISRIGEVQYLPLSPP